MSRSTVALALLLSVAARAAELHNPLVVLPPRMKPPTIDGTIGEEEWAGATRQVGFIALHKKRLSHRDGVFWLGSDGREIFVAIQSEMPPQGGLMTRVVPKGSVDVQAWRDDSIELWLDPFRSVEGHKRILYQIIANARGALYDVAHDRTKGMSQTSWRVKWRFANKVVDGWWHVELAIPLTSLGVEGKLAGMEWGVRIGRNWKQPWEQASWSPTAIAYNDPETMPVVRWAEAAPVVQMLAVGDRERTKAALATRIANPTAQPMTVKVALRNQHADSPANEKTETLVLPPGQARTVRLDGTSYATGNNLASIAVTSPDGKTTWFLRDFGWSLERPENRWRVALHEREAIDLAFGYYPYHNQIKARLDVSALPAAKQVKGATLVVRSKGADKPILRKPMPPLKDHRAEVVADLPNLADGTYEVLAELQGGEGVPKQSPAKEFLRTHFPWEHNTLGVSDRVMPPFTPLEVEGNTVRAVLRSHVMNGQGLWDQVTSRDTPLLAAPMHYEVVAEGGLPSSEASVRKTSDVSVAVDAKWFQNPIVAEVASGFDVDGMMKVTLDLTPRNATPVERLDLVIPLRDEVAPLMHVCGDGLRFNYGGEVPKGEGLVWDSTKASKLETVGAFVPYIWLGGTERGIAWFADSDRDWRLDDKKPALELTRRKGVLELRIHLISTPGPLKRRRRIVFGLQATPTKPMMPMPSWRRINSLVGKSPQFLRYHVLGATFYWGAEAYNPFPERKDFALYDLFAEIRRTGKVDEKAVLRELRKYGPDGERDNKWDASIRNAVHHCKAQPDVLIPYTNARGIGRCEDFDVFQDEWLVADYTTRSGAPVAYDVSPCRSYQDFAVWYFAKMLDSGAFDGLYFDNTFLKAHKDIVSGGAYVRDDGLLQPGVGLWHMREYLKRCAILCWQKGRPFTNVSHMTNTQIVPINTWAGINLAWEWRYGDSDAHDRFSPDYCRAVCCGFQTGSRPTALLGLHVTKKDLRPWVARTAMGWTAVHEIYPAWTYGTSLASRRRPSSSRSPAPSPSLSPTRARTARAGWPSTSRWA